MRDITEVITDENAQKALKEPYNIGYKIGRVSAKVAKNILYFPVEFTKGLFGGILTGYLQD